MTFNERERAARWAINFSLTLSLSQQKLSVLSRHWRDTSKAGIVFSVSVSINCCGLILRSIENRNLGTTPEGKDVPEEEV